MMKDAFYHQKMSALSMYKTQRLRLSREQISTQTSRDSRYTGPRGLAFALGQQTGRPSAERAILPASIRVASPNFEKDSLSGLGHSSPLSPGGKHQMNMAYEMMSSSATDELSNKQSLARLNRRRPDMNQYPSQRLRGITGSSVVLKSLNIGQFGAPETGRVPQTSHGTRPTIFRPHRQFMSRELTRDSPLQFDKGSGAFNGLFSERQLRNQTTSKNSKSASQIKRNFSQRFGNTQSFRSSLISQKVRESYEPKGLKDLLSASKQRQQSQGSLKNMLIHKRQVTQEREMLQASRAAALTPDVGSPVTGRLLNQKSSKNLLPPEHMYSQVPTSPAAQEELKTRTRVLEQVGDSAFGAIQRRYDKLTLVIEEKEDKLISLHRELESLKEANRAQQVLCELDSEATVYASHMTTDRSGGASAAQQVLKMTQEGIGSLVKSAVLAQKDAGAGGAPGGSPRKNRSPAGALWADATSLLMGAKLQSLGAAGTDDRGADSKETQAPGKDILGETLRKSKIKNEVSTQNYDFRKLVDRRKELYESVEQVDQKIQSELHEADRLRMKINAEDAEIVATKIKIQKVQPQQANYATAAAKFERLQVIDASRKQIQDTLITQKQKLADDKLKSFEEKLGSRVAALDKQQRNAWAYQQQADQCEKRINEIKKNLADLKVQNRQQQERKNQIMAQIDISIKEMQVIRQIQIFLGLQNTMKQIKEIKPEHISRAAPGKSEVVQHNETKLEQLKEFELRINQEILRLDKCLAAGGAQASTEPSAELAASSTAGPPRSPGRQNPSKSQASAGDDLDVGVGYHTACVDPERRLKEFQKLNDSIQPVWKEIAAQLEIAKMETGKDEPVDFDFITAKLKEIQGTMRSLAALQLSIQNEISDKHRTIEALKKEEALHLKDSDYLQIQILPTGNAQSPRKGPQTSKLRDLKPGQEDTFNNLKFSQIQGRIEKTQESIEANSSFCFSAYSSVAFIATNSLFFLSEIAKFCDNFRDAEPGATNLLVELMNRLKEQEEELLKQSRPRKPNSRKSSLAAVSTGQGGKRPSRRPGQSMLATQPRTSSSHLQIQVKQQKPGEGDPRPNATTSRQGGYLALVEEHPEGSLTGSASGQEPRETQESSKDGARQPADRTIHKLQFNLRFNMVKDLYLALPELARDPDHQLLLAWCAQRLDFKAVQRRFASNPAVMGVGSITMDYKHIEAEETRRLNEYVTQQRRQMLSRKRRNLGPRQQKKIVLDPDVDYYDPVTHAIDAEKLFSDAKNKTLEMEMMKKGQEKNGWSHSNKQTLSDDENQQQALYNFRANCNRLNQFERDEAFYQKQLRRNSHHVQERLNRIKLSNMQQKVSADGPTAPAAKASISAKPSCLCAGKRRRAGQPVSQPANLDLLELGFELPLMIQQRNLTQKAKNLANIARKFRKGAQEPQAPRQSATIQKYPTKGQYTQASPKGTKRKNRPAQLPGKGPITPSKQVQRQGPLTKLTTQVEIIPLPEKKKASVVVDLLQRRFPNLGCPELFKEEIERDKTEEDDSDLDISQQQPRAAKELGHPDARSNTVLTNGNVGGESPGFGGANTSSMMGDQGQLPE